MAGIKAANKPIKSVNPNKSPSFSQIISIGSNPNLKSEGSRVVGNSWIKAAVNNRRAIRKQFLKSKENRK